MSRPLDYRTTPPRPPDSDRVVLLRSLAGLLAVGATLWGVFCALFIIFGGWRAQVVFGPGYAVMVGYYWRALGRPSPAWCRAIWGWSLLVQGAWLSWVVVAMLAGPLGAGGFGILVIVWWIFATGASLIALLMEPGYAPDV